METDLRLCFPTTTLVRYADDFVILCVDERILIEAQAAIEQWLSPLGLRLKPSKTRCTHTLQEYNEERVGFDFLGFTIRQYPVGKYQTRTYRGKPGYKTLIRPSWNGEQRHLEKLKTDIQACTAKTQGWLLTVLNPQITGWANSGAHWARTAVAKRTLPDYFTTLLKEQQGRCKYCGALFTTDDIIEVHHKNGNQRVLEPVQWPKHRRVLITILNEEPSDELDNLALMSEVALARDWDSPEEDEAWSHLAQLPSL